ncbi:MULTISPECIES: PKD domain-containing protein [unclassified Marinovum]
MFRAISAATLLLILLPLSAMAQTTVATVPWLGDPNNPHPAVSGEPIFLQGSAYDANGNAVALSSASWDPGDGSGAVAVGVGNSRVLKVDHTYSGSVGQPFTATLTVTDAASTVYVRTFKVRIEPNTTDTQANVAIDKSLWQLYTRATPVGSNPTYVRNYRWQGLSSFYLSATASTVQAFAINGHLEAGDPSVDPYVLAVRRGMGYLLSGMNPISTTLQTSGTGGAVDPDGNGNRRALVVNEGDQVYQQGSVIDAIIAAGEPTDIVASTNAQTNGRTYLTIVQDLLDGYSWGAFDSINASQTYGSWNYNFNSGGGDASSSHWWAIGVLAAETWGLDAPQWLKSDNIGYAIPSWQLGTFPWEASSTPNDQKCKCTYRPYYTDDSRWEGAYTTTAACLIMMNADDVQRTLDRWQCAADVLERDWSSWMGNYYVMYQFAKAMRTAQTGGAPAPIESLNGRDWSKEFNDYLVDQQTPTGTFGNGNGQSHNRNWVGPTRAFDMNTAWGVIMLSPQLFEQGPIAACTSDPQIAGLNANVNFDGTGTSHPDVDKTIVSYSWDLDGDGTFGDAMGDTASSSYGSVGVVNVQLRVTDDGGLTDTTTCPVEVSDLDLPPNANIVIQGAQNGQICLGDTVILDGTTSFDAETALVSYEWDFSVPITFSPVDASGDTVDATAAFGALGTYDFALRVTDSDTIPKQNTEFRTLTVIEATNPICNQAPDAVAGGPYSGDEGSMVALDAGASSDPDGDAITFAWDLDNDGQFDDATGAAAMFDASAVDAPAGGSAFLVAVEVTDAKGLASVANSSITIHNVDPEADANGPYSVDEGSSVDLMASGSDAAPADEAALTFAWDLDNDGTYEAVGQTVSFDGTDDAVVTVAVLTEDDDGGAGTASTDVTVNNVAPTVVAGADQVIDENDMITLAATFTDPGTLDTHVVSVDWGDGSAAGSGLTGSHTYLDDGVYTVTVTVTDDDGGIGDDTLTVTVNNVAPTVVAGADQVIDENDMITLAATFTDPGTLDTHVVSVDWGDGSAAGSGLTGSHTYLDDGVYTVTVTVTDDDGGIGDDTLTVTVNNVAPTVVAGADQVIDENDMITLAATFTDPGTLDTHVVSVDWGDGSAAGSGLTDSHTYLDDGVYTVTVTVTDDDGGIGDDTLTVTVNNVAPTVVAGADQVIDENDMITLAATFTDPGTLDTHTVSVDWGDGSAAGSGLTDSHTYLDDGVYTVTVTVTDDDGGIGDDTLIVTVNNVAPTVVAGADQVIDENDMITLAATFTDPGTLDTHVVSVDWGDGSAAGSGLTDSHTYTDNGTYIVTVTVTDDDGGVGDDSLTVTVNNVAPMALAGGPYTVNETQDVALAGSGSDVSPDDTLTFAWDLDNNGSFEIAGATPTFSAAIIDGIAGGTVLSVALQVTDDDGGVTVDGTTVTVLNLAPTAVAGGDQVLECEADSMALATLDGSGSFDPFVGDMLSHAWTGPFGNASGVSPAVQMPLGVSTVSLTVTDDDGGVSMVSTVGITVEDTIAPVVTADVSRVLSGSGKESNDVLISYGYAESCDVAPAVTAVLEMGDCTQTIAVADGETVQFKVRAGRACKVAQDDSGMWEVQAESMTLVVTVVDESGNVGTASAIAPDRASPSSSDQNNGFGNGDQDPPGNSACNNNAENADFCAEEDDMAMADDGGSSSGGNGKGKGKKK